MDDGADTAHRCTSSGGLTSNDLVSGPGMESPTLRAGGGPSRSLEDEASGVAALLHICDLPSATRHLDGLCSRCTAEGESLGSGAIKAVLDAAASSGAIAAAVVRALPCLVSMGRSEDVAAVFVACKRLLASDASLLVVIVETLAQLPLPVAASAELLDLAHGALAVVDASDLAAVAGAILCSTTGGAGDSLDSVVVALRQEVSSRLVQSLAAAEAARQRNAATDTSRVTAAAGGVPPVPLFTEPARVTLDDKDDGVAGAMAALSDVCAAAVAVAKACKRATMGQPGLVDRILPLDPVEAVEPLDVLVASLLIHQPHSRESVLARLDKVISGGGIGHQVLHVSATVVAHCQSGDTSLVYGLVSVLQRVGHTASMDDVEYRAPYGVEHGRTRRGFRGGTRVGGRRAAGKHSRPGSRLDVEGCIAALCTLFSSIADAVQRTTAGCRGYHLEAAMVGVLGWLTPSGRGVRSAAVDNGLEKIATESILRFMKQSDSGITDSVSRVGSCLIAYLDRCRSVGSFPAEGRLHGLAESLSVACGHSDALLREAVTFVQRCIVATGVDACAAGLVVGIRIAASAATKPCELRKLCDLADVCVSTISAKVSFYSLQLLRRCEDESAAERGRARLEGQLAGIVAQTGLVEPAPTPSPSATLLVYESVQQRSSGIRCPPMHCVLVHGLVCSGQKRQSGAAAAPPSTFCDGVDGDFLAAEAWKSTLSSMISGQLSKPEDILTFVSSVKLQLPLCAARLVFSTDDSDGSHLRVGAVCGWSTVKLLCVARCCALAYCCMVDIVNTVFEALVLNRVDSDASETSGAPPRTAKHLVGIADTLAEPVAAVARLARLSRLCLGIVESRGARHAQLVPEGGAPVGSASKSPVSPSETSAQSAFATTPVAAHGSSEKAAPSYGDGEDMLERRIRARARARQRATVGGASALLSRELRRSGYMFGEGDDNADDGAFGPSESDGELSSSSDGVTYVDSDAEEPASVGASRAGGVARVQAKSSRERKRQELEWCDLAPSAGGRLYGVCVAHCAGIWGLLRSRTVSSGLASLVLVCSPRCAALCRGATSVLEGKGVERFEHFAALLPARPSGRVAPAPMLLSERAASDWVEALFCVIRSLLPPMVAAGVPGSASKLLASLVPDDLRSFQDEPSAEPASSGSPAWTPAVTAANSERAAVLHGPRGHLKGCLDLHCLATSCMRAPDALLLGSAVDAGLFSALVLGSAWLFTHMSGYSAAVDDTDVPAAADEAADEALVDDVESESPPHLTRLLLTMHLRLLTALLRAARKHHGSTGAAGALFHRSVRCCAIAVEVAQAYKRSASGAAAPATVTSDAAGGSFSDCVNILSQYFGKRWRASQDGGIACALAELLVVIAPTRKAAIRVGRLSWAGLHAVYPATRSPLDPRPSRLDSAFAAPPMSPWDLPLPLVSDDNTRTTVAPATAWAAFKVAPWFGRHDWDGLCLAPLSGAARPGNTRPLGGDPAVETVMARMLASPDLSHHAMSPATFFATAGMSLLSSHESGSALLSIGACIARFLDASISAAQARVAADKEKRSAKRRRAGAAGKGAAAATLEPLIFDAALRSLTTATFAGHWELLVDCSLLQVARSLPGILSRVRKSATFDNPTRAVGIGCGPSEGAMEQGKLSPYAACVGLRRSLALLRCTLTMFDDAVGVDLLRATAVGALTFACREGAALVRRKVEEALDWRRRVRPFRSTGARGVPVAVLQPLFHEANDVLLCMVDVLNSAQSSLLAKELSAILRRRIPVVLRRVEEARGWLIDVDEVHHVNALDDDGRPVAVAQPLCEANECDQEETKALQWRALLRLDRTDTMLWAGKTSRRKYRRKQRRPSGARGRGGLRRAGGGPLVVQSGSETDGSLGGWSVGVSSTDEGAASDDSDGGSIEGDRPQNGGTGVVGATGAAGIGASAPSPTDALDGGAVSSTRRHGLRRGRVAPSSSRDDSSRASDGVSDGSEPSDMDEFVTRGDGLGTRRVLGGSAAAWHSRSNGYSSHDFGAVPRVGVASTASSRGGRVEDEAGAAAGAGGVRQQREAGAVGWLPGDDRDGAGSSGDSDGSGEAEPLVVDLADDQ